MQRWKSFMTFLAGVTVGLLLPEHLILIALVILAYVLWQRIDVAPAGPLAIAIALAATFSAQATASANPGFDFPVHSDAPLDPIAPFVLLAYFAIILYVSRDELRREIVAPITSRMRRLRSR